MKLTCCSQHLYYDLFLILINLFHCNRFFFKLFAIIDYAFVIELRQITHLWRQDKKIFKELTFFRGGSKMLSVSSLPMRFLVDGWSPMYFRMFRKHSQASSANSVLPTSFLSSGCLSGSF